MDKLHGAVGDGLDELSLLLSICVIDTALNDTTAMTMSAHNDTVVRDGIDNELYVLARQAVETLLDNMVAVQVLDHADDVVSQRNGDGADLERCCN